MKTFEGVEQSFAALADRLERVTGIELAQKSVFELNASSAEELGELNVALLVEYGRKRRKLEEPAKCEAVDLALCAISMFFACGGTSVEEFLEIAGDKMGKWEASLSDTQ